MTGLVLLPFAHQILVKRVGHQASEWCRQVAGDNLVLMDVQMLEDALVEIAAHGVVGVQVVLLGVGKQLQTAVQLPDDLLLAELESAE